MRVRFPPRLFRKALRLPSDGEWRWQHSALLAIQHAAEQHLVHRLRAAAEVAHHAGRDWVTDQDLAVVATADR
jgi:histone H3/H4